MSQSYLSVWIVMSVLLSPLLYAQSIAAQVIPDATLPAGERSQVTGTPNVQIDGGPGEGAEMMVISSAVMRVRSMETPIHKRDRPTTISSSTLCPGSSVSSIDGQTTWMEAEIDFSGVVAEIVGILLNRVLVLVVWLRSSCK